MSNFCSSNGIIPNGFGREPLRGKIWLKKNRVNINALRHELNKIIPDIIKDNQRRMSGLKPGTNAHTKCKQAIETAIARRRWITMIL